MTAPGRGRNQVPQPPEFIQVRYATVIAVIERLADRQRTTDDEDVRRQVRAALRQLALVFEHPDLLQRIYKAIDGGRENAVCRHCGEPIYRFPGTGPASRWTHDHNVGCRANSFAALGDWDESLNRTWKAAP